MDNSLSLPEEIVKHKRNSDIVQKTADQIIKDFEIFGEEIEFSGIPDTAYQELCEQIETIIQNLMSNDISKFHNLLYRIDLEEEIVKGLMDQNTSAVSEITHLIVERELKKVLTRTYFNENSLNQG